MCRYSINVRFLNYFGQDCTSLFCSSLSWAEPRTVVFCENKKDRKQSIHEFVLLFERIITKSNECKSEWVHTAQLYTYKKTEDVTHSHTYTQSISVDRVRKWTHSNIISFGKIEIIIIIFWTSISPLEITTHWFHTHLILCLKVTSPSLILITIVEIQQVTTVAKFASKTNRKKCESDEK